MRVAPAGPGPAHALEATRAAGASKSPGKNLVEAGTPALTSRTEFLCGSFTFPARQQWATALWMRGLLDLLLGSLKSLGPVRAAETARERPGRGAARGPVRCS